MIVQLLSLESFYDNSLALDYLSAYAETRPFLLQAGVEFQSRVLRAEDNPLKFWDEVYGRRGNVVGFNTYVWNIEATIEAARKIKRQRPDTTIVMGGMEAAYTAQSLLSDIAEIDFI